MTTSEAEVSLATVVERLDGLQDLFRRRLLDDKNKNATIETLQAKLDRAERAQSAESLRPLVTRIALVIERLQSAPLTEDLRASIVEELEDILDLLGVTTFGASDMVHPRRHEIVSVTGEGSALRVAQVLRAGYEKDGVVLRPARITAVRVGVDLANSDLAGLDSVSADPFSADGDWGDDA